MVCMWVADLIQEQLDPSGVDQRTQNLPLMQEDRVRLTMLTL